MVNGTFRREQVDLLLRPLNSVRVETLTKQGMALSYLAQHDVRAHAIRVFGYGNFDIETLSTELAFEEEVVTSGGRPAYNVGYRATVQVTIRNEHGEQVGRYSESAVGFSTQPQRGEAHDMAIKTATSDAMKRCFINLGDQFGLSLYANGSTHALVKDTITKPEAPDETATDAPPEEGVHPVNTDEGAPVLTLDEDAVAFLDALDQIAEAEITPGERILRVAGLKSVVRTGLLDTVGPGGATLGYLADRVAAGEPR